MSSKLNEVGRGAEDTESGYNPLEGVMDVNTFNGPRQAVRDAMRNRAHLFGDVDAQRAREYIPTTDAMANHS
jgi:hypothetical protein